MIKRISTSTFHPRLMLQYVLKDSVTKVIFYTLALVLFVCLPSIIYYASYENLSDNELRQMAYEFSYVETKMEISDGKFVVTSPQSSNSFVVKSENFLITNDKDLIESGKCNYYITENNYEFYINKQKLKEESLTELKLFNFSFNDLDNATNLNGLYNFLNELYNNTYLPIAKTFIIFEVIFKNLGLYLFFVLLLYFVSFVQNQILPRKIRLKMVCYSLTITFLLDFLGQLLGTTLFMYIGLGISFFYVILLSRSIIRIEIKRK